MSDKEINVSNKKTVFSGMLWRLTERVGAQGVTLIVSIVLARILDPLVYGTVALVTVFTTILQVFIDGGFSTALIQKKDADDLDFSTVFYFNMVVCVFLYGLMFFCAPLIASFYENEELVPLIRVVSLILIISGVKSIQQAYVSRNMLFKKFFFATIGGTIGAAIIGIAMALMGFGVWALVAQLLFNKTVDTIVLWITVKWRPKKMFSFARLKGLFSYGWKILAANLINTFYNDLRALIIGKKYSSEDLAYFKKGEQLPSMLIMTINTTIDSVLLPAMSKEQTDVLKVKSMTRRSIRISTYILAPIMIGFAAAAPSLIGLILTDKWLPSVELLQIVCVAYMFQPIQTANLNAIKALGRSDLYLKIDLLKKVIGIILLLISMNYSVKAMTYSLLVTALIFQVVNALPNKKLLNYGYFEQLKDIFPSMLLALIMGVLVYCVNFLSLGYVITLLIQIPLGFVVYFLGSKIMKIDSFEYIIDIIRQLKNKKGSKKNA